MYTLNDICSVITDGSHFSPEDEGSGYPMLSVKDMRDTDFDFSSCKFVGEEAFQKLLANGCKPEINDVVVAKDGSYLKSAFPIKEDRAIALLSSIAILRPKLELVDPEYLSYFLKSDSVYRTVSLNYISGTALKRIILKGIKKIPIALPSIEDQVYRVKLLEKTYGIIQQRKKQLIELDNLIKARFVEMFGDPRLNPNRYPVHKLSKYIKFLTSGSRGWAKYCVDEGIEWFITIKNVKDCRITIDNLQPINAPENAEAKRTRVQEGDLLISITADLGRTGVVTKEIAEHGAYINQHLTCIRLNREALEPLYVAYFMESSAGKEQFISKNQSAVKAGLNFNSINTLQLLVPPKSVQQEFLAFVDQVDKSKSAIQKALDKAQLLFDSLMQQYFG